MMPPQTMPSFSAASPVISTVCNKYSPVPMIPRALPITAASLYPPPGFFDRLQEILWEILVKQNAKYNMRNRAIFNGIVSDLDIINNNIVYVHASTGNNFSLQTGIFSLLLR
jgi:hypothetical protein